MDSRRSFHVRTLAADLRIEGPNVVIDDARSFVHDFFGEGWPLEKRCIPLGVQRTV